MELLKVKIVKCSGIGDLWYSSQIGSMFNVHEVSYDRQNYLIQGTGLWILKSDCEIIQEEKQEQKFRQIPFDWDKYKAGMKAVFMNGGSPLSVYFIPEKEEYSKILAIRSNGEHTWLNSFGQTTIAYDHQFNLFLLEEIKQKEGWINIHRGHYGRRKGGLICDTKEKAIQVRVTGVEYIGDPIKITYYDTE